MKTKFITLAAMLFAVAGMAQTETIVDNSAVKAAVISFAQGVSSNRVITATFYPSYAPSLDKKWGFGAAVFYPLGEHAFTGLRMDYLSGDFFAAQANVGAKADFQIYGHNFTTFALTGALIPLQGAGNDNFTPGAIVGAGVNTRIYQTTIATHPLTIDLAVEGERWQVPGSKLDGTFVMHIAPSITLSF